jgi:glutaminase
MSDLLQANGEAPAPQITLDGWAPDQLPDGVDLEYRRLFASFGRDANGFISRDDLFARLRGCGLLSDDPRIRQTVATLNALDGAHRITYDEFKRIARQSSSLIKNAVQGSLAIPDFSRLRADFQEMFERVLENNAGKVADYIPQLGRVNPEQFAIAACTVDGQRLALGDAEVNFCLQSVSKPVNYCLALEEHGEAVVHRHVGREPSGRGFNELTLNKEGLPHNPLINSGAIMTCSLLRAQATPADRFDHVLGTWARLTGGPVGFNNPVYLSERQTADRNFALGYFMREKQAFPPGTDLLGVLEFYFQCCSIETNAKALAVAAAALANAGVCPTTGERVFQARTVQNCLSLMSSCGLYDFSGEFAFTIGLPAKSGVSGALLLVVPRVLGLCVWSPRLDALGNSVRGIEFCKQLVARYNFHSYDSLTHAESHKRDPRLKKDQTRIEGVVNLCWAASQGDLAEAQKLAARGVDLDGADYDGRTALHLAASEGHAHVVEYLIAQGVSLSPVDRWGGTPLVDARRHNQEAVTTLLEAALAEPHTALSSSPGLARSRARAAFAPGSTASPPITSST